jgi:hypothetical protein
MGNGLRLWRARRRHDHIDAVLRRSDNAWVLEFSRNDRLMVTRRFARQASARAEARTRLNELMRAGWIDHW